MITMQLKLQSNGSYYAECPDIDGCFTQGDTYEDALDALRELVTDILADKCKEATAKWCEA